MKNFITISLFIVTVCAFSCTKAENEAELITTLKYTLTDSLGQQVSLSFRDLDGDGGLSPEIKVTGSLKPLTQYAGWLELKNESVSPATDISEEIRQEASSHQFFFQNTLGCTTAYSDQDAQGYPLGLKTSLKTSGTGSGKLIITLRHNPDKKAAGVSSGDINLAKGETDLEISFDIEIR